MYIPIYTVSVKIDEAVERFFCVLFTKSTGKEKKEPARASTSFSAFYLSEREREYVVMRRNPWGSSREIVLIVEEDEGPVRSLCEPLKLELYIRSRF